MSVETADPPPLFFARSPSPPSFSPHHSPPPSFAAPATHFPTMPQPPTHSDSSNSANNDVDMSMSITLPPPQAQNHDRDNGPRDGAEEGEAMDTTPDGGASEEQGDAGVLATSASVQTSSEEERVAFQAIVDAANGNAIPPAVVPSDIPPPPRSGSSNDATSPPRSRSQSPRDRDRNSQRRRDTSSSEDDDDGTPPWHEIHEDTSSPSEGELKEIEARTEYSALDHEHWEEKTFTDLEDPEYRPGASGRMTWTVHGYNGTKDNPNKELIMKSEVFSIGGYDWQLKFFPRGNDSDFLSVYVDCVSLNAECTGQNDTKTCDVTETKTVESDSSNTISSMPNVAPSGTPSSDISASEGDSNLPIPLLLGQKATRSRGVCAQVGVVLYNPSEPRVHVHRTWTHRHCTKHSDYGQTRFCGPYYEIALRQRGQRAAMLRNDTLAMTAYIRIIEDSTNCLGEHSDLKSNPWNSFAMTGIQGLSMSNRPRGMSSSNIVSAVATWMTLLPFRKFLYSLQQLVPDPSSVDGARGLPMPIAKALLKMLYCLRTPDATSGTQNVGLHDLYDAMTWYGIDTRMDAIDVVQVIEIIRTKLQAELLQINPSASSAIDELLGPAKNHSTGLPTYRVEAKKSFQEAIAADPHVLQGTPTILTVEIRRQHFETSTRTWKKIVESPTKLDLEIHVNGCLYTLQSFVTHDESLQSGGYRTVIRHGTKEAGNEWYIFQDNRILSETRNNANFRVERITERQMHQLAGCGTTNPSQAVAYLATYVRSDALTDSDEDWAVAPWIVNEVKMDREIEAEFNGEKLGTTNGETVATADSEDAKTEQEPQSDVEFQVIDSRCFLQHTGPGILDIYNSQNSATSITLPATAKLSEIQEKLMSKFDGVNDSRQLRLRLLDGHSGIMFKPVLLQDDDEYHRGEMTVGKLADKIAENRLWVHVIDEKDLPPKQAKKEEEPKPATTAELPAVPDATTVSNDNTGAAIAESQMDALHGSSGNQDAVMSDAPDSNPWTNANDIGFVPSHGNPVTVIELPSLRTDANGNIVANGTIITPGGASQPVQINTSLPNGQATSMSRKGSLPNSEEVYFFLKVFDPEQQQFVAKGSFIESKRARVDKIVAKILGINGSSDAEDFPELFEEDDLLTMRSLRRRKTFQQEDLHNTAIVVAHFASKVDADALHAKGFAATPEEFLQHCSYKRNFPHLWSSDKLKFDYFSSEQYTGGWLAGKPHQQGNKISFDGSVYTGQFQLGQRHGQGELTYPNGDTYNGHFRKGNRDGYGVFTEAATGNSYDGGWQADKQFGEGIKRYKQAEYDERICRVCWVDDADAVFVDCGHVMMCLGCARRVDVCPKCRAKVKFAIKFWLD